MGWVAQCYLMVPVGDINGLQAGMVRELSCLPSGQLSRPGAAGPTELVPSVSVI